MYNGGTSVNKMLANELLTAIQKQLYKIYFAGIFSADNIPKTLKNRHFFIINTDIESGPGKHWYTIVRLNNLIECFDSLGVKQKHKDFLCEHFNVKGITHITFNTTQVQPSYSLLCGQYVLYFLFERYHNLDISFEDLLNEAFCESDQTNDKKVLEFEQEFLKNEHGTTD